MGRSLLEVSEELMPRLPALARECGFEVLAKEGYKRGTYLVGVRGPTVPDAKRIMATFYEHWDIGQISRRWLTVTFTELEDVLGGERGD